MFKKMLLAGAVILGGSMFATEKADAQVYGSVVRYGSPVYGSPVYRSPVRVYSPYVAPRYGSGYRYGYGYQSGFRGPAFGGPMFRGPAFGAPAFRGPAFRGPMYGPGWGRSGFSLSIGPVYRGW